MSDWNGGGWNGRLDDGGGVVSGDDVVGDARLEAGDGEALPGGRVDQRRAAQRLALGGRRRVVAHRRAEQRTAPPVRRTKTQTE